MYLQSTISAVFMATSVIADNWTTQFLGRRQTGAATVDFDCGNEELSGQNLTILSPTVLRSTAANNPDAIFRRDTAVDVFMHIVSSSNSTEGARLSDETMQEQVDVLNQGFAFTGFSFQLKGIDRTINATWAKFQDQPAMKAALRKGHYQTLNIYFLDEMKRGAKELVGICTYPTFAAEGSRELTTDGCAVVSSTVPGGTDPRFNQGKTATHEVGHWLGLLHTFEPITPKGDGCTGPGDLVDDTPAQKSPTQGCPFDRDSCPDQEGEDPVNNFMDYSDDKCLNNFTQGQIVRMQSLWDMFRA